ncbi:MAG: FAD-dependent oxidoreductase [Firmicutes bacterium]|nr:FAD-dependent oxidoreductase [Bacillota bacterium]
MQKQRIVVIGGVATGPKVAARARRLDAEAEITVVERGALVSYGNCGLPYYLSGLVSNLLELRRTPAGLLRDEAYFWEQKRIRVLTGTLATDIDRGRKKVAIANLATGETSTLPYDKLVLATGAHPLLPPFAGLELKGVFTLNHPVDAEQMVTDIKTLGVKRVTIIGAGGIGLEAADALSTRRLQVTMVERLPQVLPSVLDQDLATIFTRHLERQGVRILTGLRVLGLEGDASGRVRRVVTETGVEEADLVVVACGGRPNVELARSAGLALGETGAIAVDRYLRTSDPDIHAGGDCVQNRHLISGQMVYVPLASTAARHGRVIGDNLAGHAVRFPGILGTTVLQAFDYNLGRTGLSEREARGLGYQVMATLVSGSDSSHFHPWHGRLILKLVVEAESGRLLGAQAIGPSEVVKRLDVLATALTLGATVDDLASLDLGYAPPFSTPLDVVSQAGHVVQNLRRGLAKGISPLALKQKLADGADVQVLDVRQPEEVRGRSIKDRRVTSIPLGNLRERLNELDRAREVITLCELGVRGYEAARILTQEGFSSVRFLSGGLAAWPDDLEG